MIQGHQDQRDQKLARQHSTCRRQFHSQFKWWNRNEHASKQFNSKIQINQNDFSFILYQNQNKYSEMVHYRVWNATILLSKEQSLLIPSSSVTTFYWLLKIHDLYSLIRITWKPFGPNKFALVIIERAGGSMRMMGIKLLIVQNLTPPRAWMWAVLSLGQEIGEKKSNLDPISSSFPSESMIVKSTVDPREWDDLVAFDGWKFIISLSFDFSLVKEIRISQPFLCSLFWTNQFFQYRDNMLVFVLYLLNLLPNEQKNRQLSLVDSNQRLLVLDLIRKTLGLSRALYPGSTDQNWRSVNSCSP